MLHLRRGASGASNDSEEEEEAQDEAGALLFCGVATPALEEEEQDDDNNPRRHRPRHLGAITFSGAFTAAAASHGFWGTDTATLFVERRDAASGEVRVACLFADKPRTRKVYYYPRPRL